MQGVFPPEVKEMSALRLLFAIALTLGLAACAADNPATRNVSLQNGTAVTATGPRLAAPHYTVTQVNVLVPQSLKVSEANLFFPIADIVWHGEPLGDRHAQVKAIFAEAAARGTYGMTSGPAVTVDLQVRRFHCLTEKTRYTIGGTHSLHFLMTVKDAGTGRIIDGPRVVLADIKASGGARAIAEDQKGQTQRVVIVDRLSQVIRQELEHPRVPAVPVASRGDSDVQLGLAASLR